MNIYVNPVVGDSFFAREDLLNILLKSSSGIKEGYRHNIAVIGRGLIGKSSLLLQFLNIIGNDTKLIPLYINLEGKKFAEFVESLVGGILYYALNNIEGIEGPAAIDSLKKRCQKYLPRTFDLIRRVDDLIKESNYDEAYAAVFDLCVTVHSESGRLVVLVLDGFDRLSSFPVKRPFQVFGEKIMVQQKTLFVISSSSAITARKILSERLSLLFGGFEVIDVEPFTYQESMAIIKKRCNTAIGGDLMDFVIAYTGGHPFYLNSIIQKLNNARQYGSRRICQKELSMIMTELLFETGGIINQFFTRFLQKVGNDMLDQRVMLDFTTALLKTVKPSEIVGICKLPPLRISSLLSELLDAGLISKSGSLYTITDVLFRCWVEAKLRPKSLSFDFMPEAGLNIHTEEMRKRIIKFKAENRKTIDEKIVDLAASFKNDLFFIDQRWRLLPPLSFIKREKWASGVSVVIMHANKKWLFVIPPIDFTDEGLIATMKKINEIGYNNAKVVLVTASGASEPLRLLAKQKHILIWNKEDINRLSLFFRGYSAIIA